MYNQTHSCTTQIKTIDHPIHEKCVVENTKKHTCVRRYNLTKQMKFEKKKILWMLEDESNTNNISHTTLYDGLIIQELHQKSH